MCVCVCVSKYYGYDGSKRFTNRQIGAHCLRPYATQQRFLRALIRSQCYGRNRLQREYSRAQCFHPSTNALNRGPLFDRQLVAVEPKHVPAARAHPVRGGTILGVDSRHDALAIAHERGFQIECDRFRGDIIVLLLIACRRYLLIEWEHKR